MRQSGPLTHASSLMPPSACPCPSALSRSRRRCAATRVSRTNRPKTLERPDAVAVAVAPHRLEGVVADGGHRGELERGGDVARRRAGRHAAEEIRLAAAGGTGAGAAECFERVVRFVPVVPDDDEEISHRLP